jgi:very-short-patch-repair endonuclease
MDDSGVTTVSDAPSSIFQSSLPVETKLERARTELLDLSARNRLLNIPRSSKSARTIEIVDERSAEVFRLLVGEGRAFTFVPGKVADEPKLPGEEEKAADADPEEIAELAQPDDDSVDERGVLTRHSDTRLQTRLTSKGLQKRLLDLYFDARTLEEEQGVNILFLALGTLKWVDPTNANNIRYAPLILVPVSLERATAGERFKLRGRQEDLAANLSLAAYLDRVHTLKLPLFEPGEDFDPAGYLSSVAEAVASKPDWAVMPDDLVLGFFSFSKFLMYRDLDPEIWPAGAKLTEQPMIRALLAEGFEGDQELLSEDAVIDRHISPEEMLHIVDSDSSQTLAVHDVRAGRDLVIQGPPGTGKSQTIANIIAAAVADGRSVLFVAEKMAALEVVKRRLDQAGVGDACLELHSNKANKRLLLEELRRTWELGSPKGDFGSTLSTRLREARDALNGHVARMHEMHPAAALTPYQVIGQLTRLRRDGRRPVDLRLDRPETWTPDDRARREQLLAELAQRITDIGCPAEHPWRGVGLTAVLPTDVERLVGRIATLKQRLETLSAEQGALATSLGMGAPASLKEFSAIAEVARRIAAAPALTSAAMMAPEWEGSRHEIRALLEAGFAHARLREELDAAFLPAGWITPVDDARSRLVSLPDDFGPEAFERIRQLQGLLPMLAAEAGRLKAQLGLDGDLDTLLSIEKAIVTAERVAAAPDASPEAFTAAAWDHGVEQAADLADAVSALERARSDIGGRLAEAAWATDFAAARQTLAAHGSGLLRTLSGEWRRANRLIRSVLTAPDIALPEQLALLDALAKGQIALAKIRDGDGFGRAAFGADWRGDRSASAPLHALVTWMRSLRGLGAEPRLIAGRLPDRREIGVRATRVQGVLNEVRPLLAKLWDDHGTKAATAFGDAVDPDRAGLSAIGARVDLWFQADALCQSIMTVSPVRLADRLVLLDRLTEGQAALKKVEAGDALGCTAFDGIWNGARSDWSELTATAEWIDANLDIRARAASLLDRRRPAAQAAAIEREAEMVLGDLETLFSDLLTDAVALFGSGPTADLPVATIISRFGLWLRHTEQLSKWVAYRDRADGGKALGIGAIVDVLDVGRLAPADAVPTFEMAYFEAILADQIRADPALARFDGEVHGRLVKDFGSLDLQRIAAARLEVVRAHHRRIPPPSGGVGPLGILRGEMAKRRGHMPIRRLMQKAAPAIQALKPVLMMSPLSVAQFLPPGQLTFDLLVMDEASQIQPVDALGAIARCRRVVVVGDERQLPPTTFFAKLTGGQPGDDDDGDGAQVANIESILGLFTARGLPQRMLRWHYRSRHQSLIAVSNSQFYENKLFIVPSPYTQEAGMGLRFHHVADGVFDSGNTGTNAVEAKVVAEAIILHAKTSPELSLGVATFSVKQRRAIQDQLELLRRLNPDTEPFFHAHPSEPFFVKNLENVQGDERDVILISVGYGRNAQGYMAMRFGPLSSDGGERRLNVLISRAKRRCEVFASITDDDIDLERAKGKGVFAFKLFLHFARTGRLSMAHPTGRDQDSVFEVQVAAALQQRGYQVHPQVGIAGFFIDLAIADPERPGRYLLGIECDGASYHSARSARDRDRLRQSVLEDHGWILHRIWSTDWFQRPQEQLERTVAAVEGAKAELEARLEKMHRPDRAVPVEVVTIERADVTEIGLARAEEGADLSAVYVEATSIQPVAGYDLHETPVGLLADLAEKVVAVEGPVHTDEVVLRLRAAWGLQRAGARIQAAVERAVSIAVQAGRLVLEDRFLSVAGAAVRVRDRSGVLSTTLRKPEMLPPQEIRAAILETVTTNLGAGADEIVQAVSRRLGFKATSSQLREVVQSQIDQLIQQAVLTSQGDLLVMNETAPATA